MSRSVELRILDRIEQALHRGIEVALHYTPGNIAVEHKSERNDPVTEADRAIDATLRESLQREGEGWLSEETLDDHSRLACRDVWIVDPLDGTREFVEGIPEWVISVGFVEDGNAVAGGVANPQTGEIFLGSMGTGVFYNGEPAGPSTRNSLSGATVLASRSEIRRREWDRFEGREFAIQPSGSIAYKLARVATGRADVTWTLVPKHEWDVAAGVALMRAAGGRIYDLNHQPLKFNKETPWLSGLIAHPSQLEDDVRRELAR